MKERLPSRPEMLGAKLTAVAQQGEAALYCPRCQRPSLRMEWRHVWRRLKNGTVGGSPAEVLRHKACGDIVYVVLQGSKGDFI